MTKLIDFAAGRYGWRGAQILPDEYFGDPPAPPQSSIKVWDGTAWVSRVVKVWDGAAWAIKPLKRYTGSAWV